MTASVGYITGPITLFNHMSQVHMQGVGVSALPRRAPGCMQRGRQTTFCEPRRLMHRRTRRSPVRQVPLKPSCCAVLPFIYSLNRFLCSTGPAAGPPEHVPVRTDNRKGDFHKAYVSAHGEGGRGPTGCAQKLPIGMQQEALTQLPEAGPHTLQATAPLTVMTGLFHIKLKRAARAFGW